MKQPDDKTNALPCCQVDEVACHDCKYFGKPYCSSIALKDALEKIRKLEAKMPDPSHEGGSVVRTPEELKESMRKCFREKKCAGCAYNAMHCIGVIGADALKYIEELEERIDLMMIQMRGDCGVCKHRNDARCNTCLENGKRTLWEYEGLPEIPAQKKGATT